jgi:hypothetical protein
MNIDDVVLLIAVSVDPDGDDHTALLPASRESASNRF